MSDNRPRLAILFILIGVTAISVNDMVIKQLSGAYPLHQMVFVRSVIGLLFSMAILQAQGGIKTLRTATPGLHALRALLIVASNILFFAGLAVIPLADATALFFVAPLFITLLSIPVLGETVGPRRLMAVLVGFLGVILMLRPGAESALDAPPRIMLLLPVLAALCYAGMQVLTRRLGANSTAAAMTVYIQVMFVLVSVIFWGVAGDGRYAEGATNPSAVFLLRAWTWPTGPDWRLFVLVGFTATIIGYSLSTAYKSADATVIAPFEYAALPLAIFWGWSIFGDVPDLWVLSGILLIAGAGVYVFLREGQQKRAISTVGRGRR